MRANRLLVAALMLLGLFLVAMVQLVNLGFGRAPVYAAYSTMRSDPLGAKALYATLAALPGMRVERHVRRISRLAGVAATVFWLGEEPDAPLGWSRQDLAGFEAVVSTGGRLVIALLPAGPAYEAKPAKPAEPKKATGSSKPEIEKRWGLQIGRTTAQKRSDASSDARRETAVWLAPLDGAWQCKLTRDNHCRMVERKFGAGTIVLTSESFPLSNEGLREARRPEWIAELAGSSRGIIFDEAHLGFEETASVGTLIRQFRLETAALMLVTLAALFIWRNSSSFLPFREPAPDTGLSEDPHRSLTLLLRRSVGAKALGQTCLDEWQRAQPLLPYRQRRRLAAATAAARQTASPLDAWRRVREVLQEKS
jgi:hypothetical protein